ncbi:MAG: flagellar M-ring protein FliF C-terminal domain-containing protein [Planctomycetia bacterium]|nr:MAG: flagellar M-ring protein FliF C-terminal domain-containing protein [Planctomycetia bacterium]
MDFLNKAYAQLRDLFLSMTPAARITAALLLAVIVTSLGYLFHDQVSGPDGYLMGGTPFSPKQLHTMLAAFASANLDDVEVTPSGQIRIPSGGQSRYMGALADAGALPPQFGTYMDQALHSGNLLEGPSARKERLKVAKQKELARMIGEMEGIANDSVSVFFDTQAPKGFRREFVATATVSVGTNSGEPLAPARVPSLRKAVAGAILGLVAQNVTVVDLNGATYAGGTGAGVAGAVEDQYYMLKMQYEQNLTEKIRSQISFVRGAQVEVNAELDRELRHVEESVKHDPKSIEFAKRSKTVDASRDSGQPGGRPGLSGQGGPSAPAVSLASTKSSKSTESVTEEESRNALSTTTLTRELSGLVPKQIRVSVTVPSSYYRKVWAERKTAADGQAPTGPPNQVELGEIETQVKQQIRAAVLPLLEPTPAGVDVQDLVSVATFDKLPPEPVEGPSSVDNAIAWLTGAWSTLAMFGLAFFSLLMVRSMVKSLPPAEPAAAASLPTFSVVTDESHQADSEEESAEAGPRRHFIKGPSVKDELAEMVREDPETAAHILRNWIVSAG